VYPFDRDKDRRLLGARKLRFALLRSILSADFFLHHRTTKGIYYQINYAMCEKASAEEGCSCSRIFFRMFHTPRFHLSFSEELEARDGSAAVCLCVDSGASNKIYLEHQLCSIRCPHLREAIDQVRRMRLRTLLAIAFACGGVEASLHLNWCGLRHGEEPSNLVGCRQISAHDTDEAKRILSTLPDLLPIPLTQLDLASSKISKVGVTQLGALLSAKTTHIEDLDLTNCGVGDAGVAELVDAVIAAGNKTRLEGFDVSHNGITSEGAISLAKLISTE